MYPGFSALGVDRGESTANSQKCAYLSTRKNANIYHTNFD